MIAAFGVFVLCVAVCQAQISPNETYTTSVEIDGPAGTVNCTEPLVANITGKRTHSAHSSVAVELAFCVDRCR